LFLKAGGEMKTITALRREKAGRGGKVRVYLDGKPAFWLEKEVAEKHHLRTGQELNDDEIEALTRANSFQRCLTAALRYLEYRPHSEEEMRQKLARRGFESDYINSAISKLKEQGLIDDAAFARFWQENRQSFRPRSQRMTRLELRRKGIDSTIINRVIGEIDDSESAYRVASTRARLLKSVDYDTFRRRLGEYLRRRGFDYEVIGHTIAKIWTERDSQG